MSREGLLPAWLGKLHPRRATPYRTLLIIDYFKSKPSELPKITLLVDHGYHPDKLTIALEQIYPQIMTKIQFELSAKPSKGEKEAQGLSGFVPVAARWVIERSNAWVER